MRYSKKNIPSRDTNIFVKSVKYRESTYNNIECTQNYNTYQGVVYEECFIYLSSTDDGRK